MEKRKSLLVVVMNTLSVHDDPPTLEAFIDSRARRQLRVSYELCARVCPRPHHATGIYLAGGNGRNGTNDWDLLNEELNGVATGVLRFFFEWFLAEQDAGGKVNGIVWAEWLLKKAELRDDVAVLLHFVLSEDIGNRGMVDAMKLDSYLMHELMTQMSFPLTLAGGARP